jgi:cytochrome c oxidase subunit 2
VSPWWWTPIASNWGYVDTTIIVTFWITGVVFVAILLFMAYCCYKFSYKKSRKAEYEPESPKLELWLTIGTAVGVAGMLTPGLIVWGDFVTVPDGASEIEVLGEQWSWNYRFPGEDGKLGTSDNKNITDDNPFGINPNDPNGQDDVLIMGDDLHVPLGHPIKMLLRSKDVLHDFYVPQIRAKMDIVPGMVTYFWFTPTRTGAFDILCAELCGEGHYAMQGDMVIEEAADFEAWLDEQETFSEMMSEASNDTGDNVKLVLSEGEPDSEQKGIAP